MFSLPKIVLTVCTVVALTAPSIYADDFAPPPWPRAHPNAVTAEWEFFAPVNPLGPDGGLTNVGVKGTGPALTSATVVGTGGLGWGAGDGDGAWFFPAGGSIDITMNNVVDLEPFKYIRVQVTHTPGLPIAIDPMPAANFGATGSVVVAPPVFVPVDPTHSLFIWDMSPNPPFEMFSVIVGGTGEVDQVVVDTISIPEPASISIVAIGALALLRRRRTA
jgi:hypothetical protein